MILFIHSFQVLNTLSCMVLTAVNADVGGHFNIVIGLLVFRRRRCNIANTSGSVRNSELRTQNSETLFRYIGSWNKIHYMVI